jgi:hypothetical protein
LKGIVCVKLKIDRDGMRRAHIGAGVGFLVMLAGAILFHDAGEGVIQAVGLVGFIVACGVYLFLDERARRRQERDQ